MKRIYLMQRHAEKQAALTRAQREKEAKDRLREQATEAAAQRARAERQLQEALAEVPPTPLLKTMHGRINCHQQCQLTMALSRSPVIARSNILRQACINSPEMCLHNCVLWKYQILQGLFVFWGRRVLVQLRKSSVSTDTVYSFAATPEGRGSQGGGACRAATFASAREGARC